MSLLPHPNPHLGGMRVKELLYAQVTEMRSDPILHRFSLGPQFPHLYNGAHDPRVAVELSQSCPMRHLGWESRQTLKCWLRVRKCYYIFIKGSKWSITMVSSIQL